MYEYNMYIYIIYIYIKPMTNKHFTGGTTLCGLLLKSPFEPINIHSQTTSPN